MVDGTETIEGSADRNRIRKTVYGFTEKQASRFLKKKGYDYSKTRLKKIIGEAFAVDNSKVRKFKTKTVRYIDLVARIELYEHYLKKGKTKEEAQRLATDAFVDPRAKNTPFLSNLDTFGIVPFARFFRNQLPYVAYMAKENPVGLFGSYALYGALQEVSGFDYVKQDSATLVGTVKDMFDPHTLDLSALREPYLHLD
jgi:hypothetical protein